MAGNIFKRKPTTSGGTDLRRLSETEASLAQSSFNIEKITDIQNHFTRGEVLLVPGRVFIREGVLWKICRKGPKKRQFFLFNDVLVYGSILSRGLYSNQHILPISSMTVSAKCHYMPQVELETEDGGGGKQELDPDNAFQINHADKSFHVFAQTRADKTNWIANLTKQINKLNKGAESTAAMLYKAVWVPDSVSNQCMICKQKFSPFIRKHHCRMCGRIVCSQCSPHKADIAQLSGAVPSGKVERVCRQCNKPLVLVVGGGETHPESSKGTVPGEGSKPNEEAKEDEEEEEREGKEEEEDSTETEDSDDSEAEDTPVPPPRKKKQQQQQKDEGLVKLKQAPPPRPAPPKLSPANSVKKVPPPRPQSGPPVKEKSPPPPCETQPVPLPRQQTTPTVQRKEEEPVRPEELPVKPVAAKRTKLPAGAVQIMLKEEETTRENKEEEEGVSQTEESHETNLETPPPQQPLSTEQTTPPEDSEATETETLQVQPSETLSTAADENKKVPVHRRKKYQSDNEEGASLTETKTNQVSPLPAGGRSPSVNARPRKSKFASSATNT